MSDYKEIENQDKTLGDAVCLEDDLSIQWLPMADDKDQSFYAQLNVKNETTLRIIHSVGEFFPDLATVMDQRDDTEMLRMEFKLNLLLEMVGKLLSASELRAAQQHVKMTGTHISWQNKQSLSPGEKGVVELFIEPRYPRAVELPAEVMEVEKEQAGFRVTARFIEMDENVQDWLDRIIFRFHRRIVAKTRREV